MTLVFYISGHGFGHASRALEVVRAILVHHPDIRVVIRSSVAKWFLEGADLPATRVEFQDAETDVGMVQLDSLRIDEDATAMDASQFYAGFEQRTAAEAEVLRRLGAAV